MTQLRKEPTFGEPSKPAQPEMPKVEMPNLETTSPDNAGFEKQNAEPVQKTLSFSLHSTQSPGHTFTPVMKRPAQAAQELATMEEQAEQKIEEKVAEPTPTPSQTSFVFTPAEEENSAAAEPENRDVPPAFERVMPAQNSTAAKKPNSGEKVPSKYRRLILVVGLALALLLVFFLLKPDSPETVEELQNQGSSLPIEFRPVDEAEARRAEEEAKALQQMQQQQAELAAQQQAAAQQTATPVADATTSQPAQSQVEPQVMPAPEATPAAEPVPMPVAVKPVVTEPVKTPSVIYQPEHKPEPVRVKPVAKTEAAKPAAKAKAEPVKAETKMSASKASSTKTLTVTKGVTLFQNFRDNGLGNNLSELNKMTKLNGETSRLNPGQKITVHLDKQNRIVEMNIGSGKYIRQADGNYIYK